MLLNIILENVHNISFRGAEINAVTDDNETPLMYAVYWNAFEAVEALLSYRADMTVKDIGGMNILHIAALENKLEILKVCYTSMFLLNPTITLHLLDVIG